MTGEREVAPWPQSFPFSCGPAALASVLTRLGWNAPRDHQREEVAIWRESTAVACPGTHPFGLALAAHRRGFAAAVSVRGPRPWLWEHIRADHGISARREYAAVERQLAHQCKEHDVAIHWPGNPAFTGAAGLLLTAACDAPGAAVDPHWIGVVSSGRALWVADPKRRSAYRSSDSVRTWWERSGFEGTRSWIAIRGPTGKRPEERDNPRKAEAPSTRRKGE